MGNVIVDTELEEFAQKIVQSKSVNYDMTALDLFLLKDFYFNDLEKILRTRKIKTVFNCLKKNGFVITYVHFCRIVAKGGFKEKTRIRNTPKAPKENSASTNSSSEAKPEQNRERRNKSFRDLRKEYEKENAQLYQEALIAPLPSVAKRIEERKKKLAEKEKNT